jgi:transcription elongation factor Elf1
MEALNMGRRKRKIIRGPRKRLPKVFSCPKCGINAIRVVMMKGNQTATVKCGNCGLQAEFSTVHAEQPIDIYCKFTDKFNSGELV